MPHKKKLLSVFICLTVSAAFTDTSLAQPQSQNQQHADHDTEAHHYSEVEEIIVRALPMRRTRMESAQPVDVLAGELLDDRRGLTLGETLQSQPGVQSSFYGAGSGRPVIRGLGGPRVRVLEDGLSTADTSTQSDDHAVSADPLLIDQIEILRGPATLLYGSAASAGVVNLIDGRIPERLPEEPFSGRFEVRGDSIAEERSGVLRLDGARGQLAWHLDGSWRDADDYRIPGVARLEDHDDDHEHDEDEHGSEEQTQGGRLENSFVESRSGTGGLSWIGERGFIGASVRTFSSEYGIPAPHAHFEDEHDEDHEDDHEDHEDHEDEFAYIDMLQRSWDIKAGLDNPFRGAERLSFRYGLSEYEHTEVELSDHEDGHEETDDHDHGGTLFDVKTWQARLSLETSPWAGWQGAVGFQAERENFQAEGAEAFIADSLTRTYGLFVLQERTFDNFTLSLGARFENSRVSNLEAVASHSDHDHDDEHDDHSHDDDHELERPFADKRHHEFSNVSASIGGIYEFNENWQMSVNFARSQRAPAAVELLAEGPHLATFTYEVGNGGLNKEVSKAWDITLHRHSTQFDFEVTVFRKDIQDFIYLADTDLEVGGFPVRLTTQDDAEFSGIEAQGVWQLFTTDYGHFELRAAYDQVNARLSDGSRLPRISPARLSGGLDWHRDVWRASLEATRVMKQDKVPVLEDPVAAYTMVNAKIARQFVLGDAQFEAFIQGRNLGDSEARVATSYLKDYAPLPGRNLVLGVRGSF